MGKFWQSSFWKKMSSAESKEECRVYCYTGKKPEDIAVAMDELEDVMNKYSLRSGKKRTAHYGNSDAPDLNTKPFLVKEGKKFTLFSLSEYKEYVRASSNQSENINSVLKKKNPRLGSIDLLKINPNLTPEEFERLKENELKLNPDNLFSPKLIDGQILWEASGEVDGFDVEEIVGKTEALGRSLHINTGTHGLPNGDTVLQDKEHADSNFSKEDLALAWNRDNVSIHIVSQGSPEKTHDHYKIDIINAWCFSAASKHNYVGDNENANKIQSLFRLLTEMKTKAAEKPHGDLVADVSEKISVKSESGSAVGIGGNVSGSHNNIGNTTATLQVPEALPVRTNTSNGETLTGIKRGAPNEENCSSQARKKKQRHLDITESAAIIFARIIGLNKPSIKECLRVYGATNGTNRDEATEIAKQLTIEQRDALQEHVNDQSHIDELIEKYTSHKKNQNTYRA